MGLTWSKAQTDALGADAATAERGWSLSMPHKWDVLGRSQRALWGEVRGSSDEVYQVAIDVAGMAHRCGCRSRIRPCKHVLGLGYAVSRGGGAAGDLPAWVAEWLAARDGRNASKVRKSGDGRAGATVSARHKAIDAGIEDLDARLRDLVRQGVGTRVGNVEGFLRQTAARLVDAKAGGLAREVRLLLFGLDKIATGGADGASGREEWFFEKLGRLHLLARAWRHRDRLTPEERADVEGLVGIHQTRDELVAQGGVGDRWVVVAVRCEVADRLRSQRTWLVGAGTGRVALFLDYAPEQGALPDRGAPGSVLVGELSFYRSAWPVRAVVRTAEDAEKGDDDSAGAAGIPASVWRGVPENFQAYGTARAACPWVEWFPMGLCGVRPERWGKGAALVGPLGERIPLRWGTGERLLLAAEGRPIDVFGEWTGLSFEPLSSFAPNGRLLVRANPGGAS